MDGQLRKKFIDIYNKYADQIYRYCFFRVYAKNLAEELMQETFMKMWKYMSRGKQVDSPQALLYSIARNLIIDLSRRNNIKRKIERNFDAFAPDQNNKDLAYDGATILERGVLVENVLSVMKQLPGDSRDILIMRYIEGLSPKEIANVLHTKANNISVNIYKTLKRMQGLIQ